MKKLLRFFKDVRQELRYVSWPTTADIKEGTMVVIFMSAIVAIFLSLVDGVFSYVMRLFIFKG